MKWFTRRSSRWGLLLLGIWLIAEGALQLIPQLRLPHADLLLALLAVAAGVLILLDR